MHDRSYERHNHRVQNVHYEKDIRYVLQIYRWFLTPIGIWPLIASHPSKGERILSPFLITTCFSALCFVCIPFTHYIVFQEKDLYIKLKMAGSLIFVVICMIKYCYLTLQGSALGRCVNHIENDWKILEDGEHRAIMMENVTVGRNIIRLFAGCIYTGGMSYHALMPLLSSKKINENVTIRILAYPGYDKFVDPQASPTYEILFCVQNFTALVMITVTIAECGLATIFVTHACGQIQIQMARLKVLVTEQKKKKTGFVDPLTVIVERHVETLRFSKDIEMVLREICLFEIVASTLLICMAGYLCVMEWKKDDAVSALTYFIILICFTFEILIFCYIGELLVEECRRFGVSSYEVEWYDLPDRRALDLILMIAISNYPPKLTAGKIFELSLPTFSNVLRTAMVYLNLLRTLTE